MKCPNCKHDEHDGGCPAMYCDCLKVYMKPADPTNLACPFCKDPGFDLIGLKIHFEQTPCDQYVETPLKD